MSNSSSSTPSKSKAKRSKVWRQFEIKANDPSIVICRLCPQFEIKRPSSSTTVLWCHLRNRHYNEYEAIIMDDGKKGKGSARQRRLDVVNGVVKLSKQLSTPTKSVDHNSKEKEEKSKAEETISKKLVFDDSDSDSEDEAIIFGWFREHMLVNRPYWTYDYSSSDDSYY